MRMNIMKILKTVKYGIGILPMLRIRGLVIMAFKIGNILLIWSFLTSEFWKFRISFGLEQFYVIKRINPFCYEHYQGFTSLR